MMISVDLRTNFLACSITASWMCFQRSLKARWWLSRISIFDCLMFSSISAAILFRMTDFVIWMPYSICLRNLSRGFEKRV